jgi:hypothetical protein
VKPAVGRYVVGDSWGRLIADYDILEDKVWGLFILWVGLAPFAFYRIKT